jgi:hypothetical protein
MKSHRVDEKVTDQVSGCESGSLQYHLREHTEAQCRYTKIEFSAGIIKKAPDRSLRKDVRENNQEILYETVLFLSSCSGHDFVNHLKRRPSVSLSMLNQSSA